MLARLWGKGTLLHSLLAGMESGSTPLESQSGDNSEHQEETHLMTRQSLSRDLCKENKNTHVEGRGTPVFIAAHFVRARTEKLSGEQHCGLPTQRASPLPHPSWDLEEPP